MTDRDVAEAQKLAAQLHAQGAPVALQGEPHSPKRIMFFHGATTGHASCACPVIDEHGHNVNPGRAPLERKAAGRAEGSRKAAETFARQRARKAADELALIAPALWDDATRKIVLTLATLAAPSRIDDMLSGALPVTLDELDALVARLDGDAVPLTADERDGLVHTDGPDCPRCAISANTARTHLSAVHDNGDYRA